MAEGGQERRKKSEFVLSMSNVCSVSYGMYRVLLCLPIGVVKECVLGGVTKHIKAFKLHLLNDQREFLAESP